MMRSAPRPCASSAKRLLDGARVRDLGAVVDGDLGRRADLAVESADDEKPHDYVPLVAIV